MDTGKHWPCRATKQALPVTNSVVTGWGPLRLNTHRGLNPDSVQKHSSSVCLCSHTDIHDIHIDDTMSKQSRLTSSYNRYLSPSHKLHHLSSALIRFDLDQWGTWIGIQLMNRNKPRELAPRGDIFKLGQNWIEWADLISGISAHLQNSHTEMHTQTHKYSHCPWSEVKVRFLQTSWGWLSRERERKKDVGKRE